jgi:glucose uptake protein
VVLPTTATAAFILLTLSLVCLGSWANLFKLAGRNWRFQLFYYDFGCGALLFALIAAYTFGTFGSDLSFSDRMIVAGRTAQALLAAAGFLFNLANMLLVASISLIGIAAAFPLCVAIALIVTSFWYFRASNFFIFITAIVLLLVTVLLDVVACRLRDRTALASQNVLKSNPRQNQRPVKSRRTGRGIGIAAFGGILMGFVQPIASRGLSGELGLGPYAGILLFSVGMIVSTLVCNFYFLNIAIEGPPVSFSAYFHGKPRQHFLGFASGAILVLGLLAALLAASGSAVSGLSRTLLVAIPIASVILHLLWGIGAWNEFVHSPRGAKTLMGLVALLFAGSLWLFALGVGAHN